MSSFTTLEAVEKLIRKGQHSDGPTPAKTKPTETEISEQMEADASTIRGALRTAGLAGDPVSGTDLYGMCTQANNLLSAAYCIPMHSNVSDQDLQIVGIYLDSALGKDRKSGLLAAITALARNQVGTTSSGSSFSAVSTPERSISDLVHFGDNLS